MKTRGVSFRHAVGLLREGLPSSAAGLPAETAAPITRTTVRALPAPVAFDADDAQLLGQVADYYAATLKQSPEAMAYLESRGIAGSAAAQAIEVFKLGYANRTLGLRLPEKTRKAGAEICTRLERLGVYRDSGHEHMNGSLVIPLFDPAGQVVNLYGRKIRNDLRAGTPAHLYLPGSPRRGVFNRAAFVPGACEELIVCEALIDALTFWCAGLRNVISAYGVEGVTDELILPLQAWFKWLTKQNHILYNPAADLDLPTRSKALPKGLLSIGQVEDVLNGCDITKPEGLRMRAMLEVLYSTGIRRFELAGVKLFDVDVERGALMVRQGKGAKDRLVPVGERACAWVDKYLREMRPELATGADDYRLFLDDDGRGFTPERVGDLVRRQLTAAGVEHPGSCHLFRVACATHMAENGAVIRFIQSLLGHAKLDTTQIYTLVSLAKLKEVHNATHPARLHRITDTAQDANTASPGAKHTLADTKGAATFLAALQREADSDGIDGAGGIPADA